MNRVHGFALIIVSILSGCGEGATDENANGLDGERRNIGHDFERVDGRELGNDDRYGSTSGLDRSRVDERDNGRGLEQR